MKNATIMATHPRPPNLQEAPFDVGIIGLGQSGQSCLRYFTDRDKRILAVDTRTSPPGTESLLERFPKATVRMGDWDPNELLGCRRLVVSPGIDPNETFMRPAVEAGISQLSDIAIFAMAATAPVIAVTGTNGKSTVTTMIAQLIERHGYEVLSGGNLGRPALDLLAEPVPDFYVLELSSFQLALTPALGARVACVLNLSADHLDRHGNFDAYRQAKANILIDAGCQVLNLDDPAVASLALPGKVLWFSGAGRSDADFRISREPDTTTLVGPTGPLMNADSLKLEGAHNLNNFLAALCACHGEIALKSDIVRQVAGDFEGLPHRAQVVAEAHGIRFIDDSKATNVGAAASSVKAIFDDSTGVLIAGGRAKEDRFEALADAAIDNVHTVVLMGEAATKIDRPSQVG